MPSKPKTQSHNAWLQNGARLRAGGRNSNSGEREEEEVVYGKQYVAMFHNRGAEHHKHHDIKIQPAKELPLSVEELWH